MEQIYIGIIEDDEVVRESLVDYLGDHPAINISLSASSVESFIEQLGFIREPRFDILLLDIGLPGMSGLDGIRPIKKLLPKVDVVMLTTFEDEEKIFKALCAGAVSYISKRTRLAQIQEAVISIYRGGAYISPAIARKVINYFAPRNEKKEELLSNRQKQIVQGIVDGLSYKMIADKYMISINTVRDHIKKIYQALEINSKAELIRKSIEGSI